MRKVQVKQWYPQGRQRMSRRLQKGVYMKTDCDIIKDLLPLYTEGLASEKSRIAVEEHLEDCEECRAIYREMREPKPQIRYNREPAESFRRYAKKEKSKLRVRTAVITTTVILLLVAVRLIAVGGLAVFLAVDGQKAEIHEDTDVSHYARYMGEKAEKEYVNKWGMKEDIFPGQITEKMQVADYKMVYYNPWDAQYLSYLVVEYDEEAYAAEAERLKNYGSTEYLGYYGAEGFPEGYTLLAMEADPYYGFVYALETGERQIVYVELIFCNYFMDLDYEEMIPAEFLPTGFDATKENAYRKQMLGEQE